MKDWLVYLDFGVLGATITALIYAVRTMWKHLGTLTDSYRKDIKEMNVKHDDLVKNMDERQARRDDRQEIRDNRLNEVLRELTCEIARSSHSHKD